MTNDTLVAAERLADVLTRENAALAALELHRAAAMLDEKQQAVQAFAAVQAAMPSPPTALAQRLRDLAEENRCLLERAIAVQSRIIGMIARAVPQADSAPRYGTTGTMAAVRPAAFTVSAHA